MDDQSKSPEAKYNIQYYVICVIDILGQKEYLKGWQNLPTYEELPPDCLKALKKTAGTILMLKRAYQEYFTQSNFQGFHSERFNHLPEDQRLAAERSVECRLEFCRLSDAFVFFSPLTNANHDQTVIPLHTMLGACCWSMVLLMAGGVPLRGGLCIGSGIEFEKGDFYGPGLAIAHEIESKFANYPRIAVSENVLAFLRPGYQYSRDSKTNKFMAGMAGECRNYLAKDSDGRTIVDTFGQILRDQSDSGREFFQSEVVKAYKFVRAESARFASMGDSKLLDRYELLRRYIETRLPIWGIPVAVKAEGSI